MYLFKKSIVETCDFTFHYESKLPTLCTPPCNVLRLLLSSIEAHGTVNIFII